MIGIYKIPNKLNGKSYIGQSIHCGRRLDEHCNGNQLIDEVIQLEGIENFTFEILKQCDKSELAKWEDYYIIQYNTMFPEGYNKRWNTAPKERFNIISPIKQEVETFEKIETLDVEKYLSEIEQLLIESENENLVSFFMSAIVRTYEWDFPEVMDEKESYTLEDFFQVKEIIWQEHYGKWQKEYLEKIYFELKFTKEKLGYRQIELLPDIHYRKSSYTPLQKKRFQALQQIVKEYNSLQLCDKYSCYSGGEIKIDENWNVEWWLVYGCLVVHADQKVLYDLLKKMASNGETDILKNFYIKENESFGCISFFKIIPALDFIASGKKSSLYTEIMIL